MIELEKQIIQTMEDYTVEENTIAKMKFYQRINILFSELLEKVPVGKCSREFFTNEKLIRYLESQQSGLARHKNNMFADAILFRIAVEKYLGAENNALGQENFRSIQDKIKEIRAQTFNPNGQGLLPRAISPAVIRSVYLSANEPLIALFQNQLPVPNIALFAGYAIPEEIKRRTEEATIAVLQFLGDRELSAVEPLIKKIQRNFSAKKKQKEERVRIARHPFLPREGDEEKGLVEHELAKANRPYRPHKCSPQLSNRIFKVSRRVELFKKVRHMTSESGLESMFNYDASGRAKLLKEYLSFEPASLFEADLAYGGGDANVVCLGPNEIDPEAYQDDDVVREGAVELLFDFKKLETKNPCMFYKQRDLAYWPEEIRELNIGIEGKRLLFSHTRYYEKEWKLCLMSELPQGGPKNGEIYLEKQGNKLKYIVFFPIDGNEENQMREGVLELSVRENLTHAVLHREKVQILEMMSTSIPSKFGGVGSVTLQIFNQYKESIAYSQLPNYLFIAYNLPKMHQILTLNFFRFLDNLKVRKVIPQSDGEQTIDVSATEIIASIYADIEKLDEKQLEAFLTKLGREMTITAELNFYRVCPIIFSALETIIKKKTGDVFDLPLFITQLKLGAEKESKESIEKLASIFKNYNETIERFPTIFKSYRFLDYLISNVENEVIKQDLLKREQEALVKAPMWMRELHRRRTLQAKPASEDPSVSDTLKRVMFIGASRRDT